MMQTEHVNASAMRCSIHKCANARAGRHRFLSDPMEGSAKSGRLIWGDWYAAFTSRLRHLEAARVLLRRIGNANRY
eukprot:6206456-Pleurochrysis_carterae.AAC.6